MPLNHYFVLKRIPFLFCCLVGVVSLGVSGCSLVSNGSHASVGGADPQTVAHFRTGQTETLRLQTGGGYQSAWAEMFPETLSNDVGMSRFVGTRSQSRIVSDFYAAATSKNLSVAELRWASFLRTYVLPGGEYEDGTAAQLCQWSQAELERCRVLAAGKPNDISKFERKLRSIAKELGVKISR